MRFVPLAIASLCLFSPFQPGPAEAGDTIKCKSKHNKYTECPAPFRSPMLIKQTSSQPCILNSTWGFNPVTRHIWVAAGCNGKFADAHGFHHGRSGGYDANAHRYNINGDYIGVGPIITYNKTKISNNVHMHFGDSAGIGPHFDPEVKEDDSWKHIPQFDKNGNPNFDTDGNYQGPHGLGALVDAPVECDAEDDTSCSN
jgi:hypothetical protein